MLRWANRPPTSLSATLAVPIFASSSRGKKTCGFPPKSKVKKSARAMGMPSRTFLRELTDGLTRFCSIKEINPLVTPARFANSRCDKPYICLTAFKWVPTSMLMVSIIIDRFDDCSAEIELNVDFPYHRVARLPLKRTECHECPPHPRRSDESGTRCILDALHRESPIQGESASVGERQRHVLHDI